MEQIQCRFCNEWFDPIVIDDKPRFPVHKQDGFACEGAGEFLSRAIKPKTIESETPIRPVDPPPEEIWMKEEDKDAIQLEFEEFHRKNPHIYELFVRFAREAKDAGFKKYSLIAITERVRWHVSIDTGQEAFKINNDFRSRYSRLIMLREKDLAGFFEIRVLQSQKAKTAKPEGAEEDYWWKKED